MKDHKEVTIDIDVDYRGEPVESFIANLRMKAATLKDPTIHPPRYYDSSTYLKGWREFTEAEKEAAARRRESARRSAEKRKAKAREKELAQLERLAKKHGKVVREADDE